MVVIHSDDLNTSKMLQDRTTVLLTDTFYENDTEFEKYFNFLCM